MTERADGDVAPRVPLGDQLAFREPRGMVALAGVSVVMAVLGIVSALLQVASGSPWSLLVIPPHLALWGWIGGGAWRRTWMPPTDG